MYCHNCGTKLPDDSAFCPNCGTPLSGAAESSPKRAATTLPKNRYYDGMGVNPDPYNADPRWKGLFYYMVTSLVGGAISIACILVYFLAADMHYDYQYSAFGFLGICISVVAFFAVQAVSRPKLVRAFGNTQAADAILKHKSLVTNGVRCGSDDDADIVDYFMERYKFRSNAILWSLLPFIITGFLYFSPGLF